MSENEEDLRERALKSIKKKRDFAADLVAYVVINGFLVALWAVVGGGFFWPIFPILGWGIGVIFHGWDVYRGEPTEADIQREMRHLQH